ncbi:MAG: hypothetical protein RJA05_57 [Planctomycetota bacterium]
MQALRQADLDAGVGVLIVRLIERSSGPRADCPVCGPPSVGTGWMRSLRAELPNTPLAAKLALELRLCPGIDREDALQEAWLAALEGRNPARAVNTFAQRERRHRRREAALGVDAGRSFRLFELRAARTSERRHAKREASLSARVTPHA